MEAIAIGDLHYDSSLCNLVEGFNRVINQQVQSVLDWASKRGVTNVILLGDICESPRLTYDGQECLLDLICSNPDMQFYIILGNHDLLSKDPSVGHSLQPLKSLVDRGLIKNVNIYEKPTNVTIDSAKVRFLPWPSQDFSDRRLNIAHIEVSGAKLDSGKSIVKGYSDSSAVAVIGHLHTAHRIRNTHYTGTLYQTKFGMKPRKGFHYIQFNSVNDYVIEWVPVKPIYQLVDIVVEGPKDLQRIPNDPNQLVRLIISDGAEVDPTMWATKSNVVKVSPFKTKEDLVKVLTEHLDDADSLKINVVDYLKAWLEGQSYEVPAIKDLLKTRKRYVNGVVRGNQ